MSWRGFPILAWALSLALVPSMAEAGLIAAALGAIQSFAAAGVFQAFVTRIGFALVFSALSQALAKKPDTRQSGLKTDATTSGSDTPQSFILGRYATGGNNVTLPYSHPNAGAVPNEYLTYILDVGDIPGAQLSRLMVSGAYVPDLQASAGEFDFEGAFYNGVPHLFLNWHDGHQTEADAYLRAQYGAHPERPWGADRIGRGVPYAVVVFRYNREVFNRLPAVRFEVLGIPLYDPRRDTSVGGVGTHRWQDPASWTFTENPVVMIYNILRGIRFPDGAVWGGQVRPEDLPLDVWFAAMNACDAPVDLSGGGTEPRYVAGLEVRVSDEPADVIDQLLNACGAEIAELGGVWKIRVGGPGLPVYFFGDEDLVADEPRRLSPFPGVEGAHNAILVRHPLPDALWETVPGTALENAAWEAEDGGRQLMAELELPAVSSATQAQRLAQAWINDERRFRSHSVSLAPSAAVLEPLDVAAWTSARWGYQAAAFEVGELSDNLITAVQSLSLRERDAADYAWAVDDELPVTYPPGVSPALPPRELAGWAVSGAVIEDAAGAPRRGGLRLSWDGPAAAVDGSAVQFQVRPVGRAALAAEGTVALVASGERVLSEGVIPGVIYEARGFLIGARGGVWTAWRQAQVPDLRPGLSDLDGSVAAAIDAAGQANAAIAAAAEASADAAALAAENALQARAATLPATFERDGYYFRPVLGGDPFSHALGADWSFALDPAEGAIARLDVSGAPRFDNVLSQGVLDWSVGRIYRLAVRARATGAAAGDVALMFRVLDEGLVHRGNAGLAQFPITSAWADYVIEYEVTGGAHPFARPCLQRRDSLTGAGALEVARIAVEDVTQAQAAAGSAAIASQAASDAGDQAAAALAEFVRARDEADRSGQFAGEAEATRDQVVGLVDDAEGFALSASQALEANTRILSRGVAVNRVFADWPDGDALPAGFAGNAGAVGSIARVAGSYGNAVELATSAAPESLRPFLALVSGADGNRVMRAQDVDLVTVEAELELVSGSWGGARIAVEWRGAATVSRFVVLADQLPAGAAGTGAVRRVQVSLERPGDFVAGGPDDVRVLVYATSTSGAGLQANVLRVHALDVAEEILGSYARLILDARATQAGITSSMAGFYVDGAEFVLASFSAPGQPLVTEARFNGDSFFVEGTLRADWIESSNYVAGGDVPGSFYIGTDGLYLNQTVGRIALVDGAVFDRLSQELLAERPLEAPEVLFEISTGPTARGEFWEAVISAELYGQASLILQRVRVFNGADLPAENLVFLGPHGVADFLPLGGVAFTGGAYDNVRFRVVGNGQAGDKMRELGVYLRAGNQGLEG